MLQVWRAQTSLLRVGVIADSGLGSCSGPGPLPRSTSRVQALSALAGSRAARARTPLARRFCARTPLARRLCARTPLAQAGPGSGPAPRRSSSTSRGKEETVPGSKSPRETKLKSRRRSAVVLKGPSKSSGQVARLASSCAGTERARLTARMRASQMFHRSGDRAWCHTSGWLLCTRQCWSPSAPRVAERARVQSLARKPARPDPSTKKVHSRIGQ